MLCLERHKNEGKKLEVEKTYKGQFQLFRRAKKTNEEKKKPWAPIIKIFFTQLTKLVWKSKEN